MKHLQKLQMKVEIIYKKRLERLDVNDEDILLSKIVLLDTELAEFMNEIEDHKLYKLNKKNDKTKQLEELCDCIHVICSIANMLDIELDNFEEYYNSNAPGVAGESMAIYKRCKNTVNSINIQRALKDKGYIEFMLGIILEQALLIAKSKDFKKVDILQGFVSVYAKNMMRAKGEY